MPDQITEFKLGSFTNTTSAQCAFPHYALYNNLTAPNFQKGSTYTCALKMEAYGSAGYGVWIDYNHNNTFDTNEKVGGSISASDFLPISTSIVETFNVAIPTTATTGNTRMRVRIVEDDTYTGSANGALIAPCNASTAQTDVMDWGETEDYIINITSSVGIDEVEATDNLLVYPNPTVTALQLNKNLNGNVSYKIVTITGKVIQVGVASATEKQISVTDLANGVYVIQLFENNTSLGQQKFVKATN